MIPGRSDLLLARGTGLAGVLALGLAAAVSSEALATKGEQAVSPLPVPWKASQPLAEGVELWSRGRQEAALIKFQEAVKAQPRDPVAWHNLGVALATFKRYRAAQVAFRHEWFHSSLAPSAWFGMGYCYLGLNRLREAENAFVMAIEQAPREWQYWHALAETMRRQGKLSAAEAAQGKAIRLRPHVPRRAWSPAGINAAISRLRFPRVTRDR